MKTSNWKSELYSNVVWHRLNNLLFVYIIKRYIRRHGYLYYNNISYCSLIVYLIIREVPIT